MKYKGFRAEIDFRPDSGELHGRLVDRRSGTDCGVTVTARTIGDLTRAFRDAVDRLVLGRTMPSSAMVAGPGGEVWTAARVVRMLALRDL